MIPKWPSGPQALDEKVAAHRGETPAERLRALARLFDFYRELVRDPERRARHEIARGKIEEEGRAVFRALLTRGR